MLTHIYTVEVDHDFRRWLTAIGKFTWGELDYQGNPRRDKIYTVSGEAIYKMNRNVWLRGTLRRDWLDSNLPGNSTASTVVMLGVGCSIEDARSLPIQGRRALSHGDCKQKPRHFGRGPETS